MVNLMEVIESYERTRRLPNGYWALSDQIIINLHRRHVVSRKRIPGRDRDLIINWALRMAAGLNVTGSMVSLYDLCNRIVLTIDREVMGRMPGDTMDDYPRIREWLIWHLGDSKLNKN